MADIVLINPRFDVSYWGLEHALPFLGKRANMPVAEFNTRNTRSALNTLIVVANMEGDLMGNLHLSRRNLMLNRQIGDGRSEAIALSNLGVAWLELGDLEAASRDSEAALQMLRTNGDRVIEGATLCNMSDVALMRGDAASALTLARSALDILVSTKARDRELDAWLKLGQAELALGRFDAAEKSFEQMRQQALALESAWRYDALAGLARIALAQGDDAKALRHLEVVLAHSAAGGTLDGTVKPRLIELTCHNALARARDVGATAWLKRAHDALRTQATTIDDLDLRRSFLENIPYHREIVAIAEASTAAD